MRLFVIRCRRPLIGLGVVAIVAGLAIGFTDLSRHVPHELIGVFSAAGAVLLVLSGLTQKVTPPATNTTIALASPVRGRWQAMNSPTTKVPSHGTHVYGQTFAVDFVCVPAPAEGDDSETPGVRKPEFGGMRDGFLAPEAFPGFGQPLHAPAAGVVVAAFDRARDHRSRTSWPAFGYLIAEMIVRDLGGVRAIIGNHLVLRLDDSTHFVLAHLRRGSIRVAVGDRVRAGDELAECGNSGNTSEPHLHCQRQDRADIATALGLPFTIEPGGIPANLEFTEPQATR